MWDAFNHNSSSQRTEVYYGVVRVSLYFNSIPKRITDAVVPYGSGRAVHWNTWAGDS